MSLSTAILAKVAVSRFCFPPISFPLLFPAHQGVVDDSSAQGTPVPKEAPPQRAEGVVLLVEDEAPVRAFAVRALRLRGYRVLEAGCGEEALEILQDQDLSVDIFVLSGPAFQDSFAA